MKNFQDIKYKILIRENLYFLIIIFFIFFLDRYSKILIIKELSEKTFFVNDFLNLNLIWNTGIGFGLLSSNSELIYNSISFLIGIVILILIFIGLLSSKAEKFFFSLIVGGAFGNFYDRIEYKAVPDFIDLHYKNMHWFTFNVADIFITLGIIIFIFKDTFVKKYE